MCFPAECLDMTPADFPPISEHEHWGTKAIKRILISSKWIKKHAIFHSEILTPLKKNYYVYG